MFSGPRKVGATDDFSAKTWTFSQASLVFRYFLVEKIGANSSSSNSSQVGHPSKKPTESGVFTWSARHVIRGSADQWILIGEDARETTKHGLLEKGRTVKQIQRVTRKTCCRHLILQSVLGMNLVKNISIYSGFICSVVTVVFKF